MKSRAAVVTQRNAGWDIVEVDVRDPKEGEILVRFVAAGLCHSDYHMITGDLPAPLPFVGGHEGSGIVEAVGPGASRFKVGDHVVSSFVPSCGHCRWCSTGYQSLCDLGANALVGCLPDGSYGFKLDGQEVGAFCSIGTFSQYATVGESSMVKIADDIPLEVAALCGCGVPTGWGSAVRAGNVQIGDTVLIFGIGGIGINAVQGAAHAGASRIIAIDPLASKREFALEFGATHAVATAEEGIELGRQNPAGGADVAIVTVDVVHEDVVTPAVMATRKLGTTVITGMGDPSEISLQVPAFELTINRKVVKGSLFGDCNPMYDINHLLGLYQEGKLKLDELISNRYTLDEINVGYDDMVAGKNLRGIVLHDN